MCTSKITIDITYREYQVRVLCVYNIQYPAMK